MLISPQDARAETRGLSVRGNLNLALMVSSDQVQRLAYDQPGMLGAVHGGYAIARALELRAGLLGGGFFSRLETGGLLAASVGARAFVPGRRLEPYVALDAGPAWTGELTRPWLGLTAGVDIALSERIALGPTFGYQRLFQWNGPRFSTDAGNLSLGAALVYTFRQPQEQEPPPLRAEARPRRKAPRPAPEPEPTPEPSVDVIVLIERALPAPTTRVELLAPVLFAYDSDELEPVGTAMLHEVAGTLKMRPEIALVEVRGYADARGTSAYNEALALRRAERVRDWLVVHGVEGERLVIASHGATDFVESADEEQAHAQNRRVVFRILREVAP